MANVAHFKPVIMPAQQRRDGSYNVKIRVTFKRKYRILSTNLTAYPKDIDRYGQLRGNVYTQANKIITQMYDAIAELNWYDFESMDVDDLVREIRSNSKRQAPFSLDFFEYAETVMATKKPSTAGVYRTAVNSFRNFIGNDSLDINDINVSMLKRYVLYVDSSTKMNRNAATSTMKKKGLSAKNYIAKLSTIYAEAVEEFNDDDEVMVRKNPFTKIHVEALPSIARISKSPEFIQKIISSRSSAPESQRMMLDIYLISFALMGANTADLMTMKPDEAGVIKYQRQKTRDRRADNAEMCVRIEPCVRKLIDAYRDPSRKLMFNFATRWSTPTAMNGSIRYYLAQWAGANGEEPFTIYSARHAWATIGRSGRVGLSKSVIDECLAHSTNKLVDVYAERDWSILWEANAKVLSLFNWE